jgi:lipopolysaccharide transport system permease protein
MTTYSSSTTHASSLRSGGRRLGRRVIYIRDLLRELVLRDLKIRYKRSYLGILWSLATPVVQIIMFSFLFRRVIPLDIPNYTAFLFAGILTYSWFRESLSSASSTIVGNPGLVRRPGFPVAALPVLAVATSGIHFLLALPVLLLITVMGGGTLGTPMFALPLVIGVQFFFTLSLAYLVAGGNVRFRDTQHLVTALLMVGFYLTPIFYSVRMVPEQYRFVYDLNPLAHIIRAYRDILIENRLPDFGTLFWVSAVAALLLCGTFWLFRRMSVRFAEEL